MTTPITLEQAQHRLNNLKAFAEHYGKGNLQDVLDLQQYITQQAERLRVLSEAASEYLVINPAFRFKMIGAPGSSARMEQEDRIRAEDKLKAALAAQREG